ncbi:rho GTPase-activating protein gacV-like [Actinia tenebrosa]|uniref:Rho GTPase-activating protein gacV-like n=1 Tax=Actinia tenebrosa TaxID=6105 RepID=A0A6P8J796_ACTTE|nr:rho GTPase-activating protein gacV-like [Actinia tenebrosa]
MLELEENYKIMEDELEQTARKEDIIKETKRRLEDLVEKRSRDENQWKEEKGGMGKKLEEMNAMINETELRMEKELEEKKEHMAEMEERYVSY